METPRKPTPESLKKTEKVEGPMPITAHSSETLRAHIESGKAAEERVGFFAENMTFDPETNTATTIVPIEDYHQGHKLGQTSIVLGAMPKAWADISSGGFAFAQIEGDEVPVHDDDASKFYSMGIVYNEPMVVTSRLIAPDEEFQLLKGIERSDKCIYIRTEVRQGENLYFLNETSVKRVKEKMAIRIAEKTEGDLLKKAGVSLPQKETEE